MTISRLFKCTLLFGLLFVGQGAQAMLSTIGTLGKFVPKFSTNFVLPKKDPNQDFNPGGFVSKSWHQKRLEELENNTKAEINGLKEENNNLKNILTNKDLQDYILNSKAHAQTVNELKKNLGLKVDQLKKAREESKKKLECEYKGKIAVLEQKLTKEISNNKNNKATLVTEHKQAIKKLNNEHDLAIKQLKNESAKQIRESLKASEAKFEKESADLKTALKNAQASNNNRQSDGKQYSWWKNTKRWMFKKFILASAFVGSIWATNTPIGRKMYDHYIDAKLLEKRMAQAIRERDLDALKDLIERYRGYKKLFSHLDGNGLAQLALTKDDKGEDFAKGLELLLQEKIVKLADNLTIVTNTIPNSTTTFKTCKITCNIARYVQSTAALNVIITYGEKLKKEIADYNAKPEHTTKMAPFEVQELLNQVVRNPETGTYETAADIYAKNGNQELIKAAQSAGALTSKTVCEEVVKYLNWDMSTFHKLTASNITDAMIAKHRKLVPQKP